MIKSITGCAIYGCLVFGYLTLGFAKAEVWTDNKEVVDEVNSIKCSDGLSLNFSNAYITQIGENFINSPTVKCVNIANNHIGDIHDGAFESLLNLMYLNVSGNNLRRGNFLSFGGYKSLRILSVNYAIDTGRYNGVQLTASELYPELRYLSLRGNGIYSISYSNKTNPYSSAETILNAFPKIMYMDLSENYIETTDLLFCETLKYLYLQQNRLSTISINSLSNLLVLNVDGNSISRITYGYQYSAISLNGLKKLKQLSLVNNEIRYISSNAFSDTTELISVNLTYNRLESIDSTTFDSLPSLEHLILDYNLLKDIPLITIKTNLRVLSLYKNNIKSIPDQIFINSPSMEELNLAANVIEHVDVGAFAGLQRLEYLNLAKNKLTSLPGNWCTSLANLQLLDLSNNLFTSLESMSLTNIMPLRQLDLYNHQLKYILVPLDQNFPKNMTINLREESGYE